MSFQEDLGGTTVLMIVLGVIILAGYGFVSLIFPPEQIQPKVLEEPLFVGEIQSDLNVILANQVQLAGLSFFNNCVQARQDGSNTVFVPLWQADFSREQVSLGNGVFQKVIVFNGIVCLEVE